MKNKDAKSEYMKLRAKLVKEANRGGLTTQEEKIYKIVEAPQSKMTENDIRLSLTKAKAEYKRIRTTKKYKIERKYRNEFYRVLKAFETSELKREARRRLMNLPPSPDQLRASYFDVMQYQKLIKEGITRRQGGRVVRFKGLQAVKVQITSLKYATDSYRKKAQFIDTYIENMQNMGIPEEWETINKKGKLVVVNIMEEMRAFLESLEPNVITYLLDTGSLYDIKFYYVLDESNIGEMYKMLEYNRDNLDDIMVAYNESIKRENEMMTLIRQERRYKKRYEVKINKNY